MDGKDQVPAENEIIEPEPISDEEIASIDDQGTEWPKGGFHYKKVVITQSPDGSEYVHMESNSGAPGSGLPYGFDKPPVFSAWLLLIISWLFYSSPLPFTVFLGIPANIAALILALISLTRGAIGTGILVLILGTAGSIIVYLVGILRFLSA